MSQSNNDIIINTAADDVIDEIIDVTIDNKSNEVDNNSHSNNDNNSDMLDIDVSNMSCDSSDDESSDVYLDNITFNEAKARMSVFENDIMKGRYEKKQIIINEIDDFSCKNKCKIIRMPRKTKDTGYFSFLQPDITTLSQEDVTNLITDLRELETENANNTTPLDLYLVIKTKGGLLSIAESIVKILLRYPGKITVLIDEMCMSAGTLIALCGHEVYMRKYSMVGQIDPQLGNSYYWVSGNFLKERNRYLQELESPFIKDLIRLSTPGADSSIDRIEKILDRIAKKRDWDESFKEVIRANLLHKNTSVLSHDIPYDYDDMSEFWITKTESEKFIPNLHDGWPAELELIMNLKEQTIDPNKSSNILKSFNLV